MPSKKARNKKKAENLRKKSAYRLRSKTALLILLGVLLLALYHLNFSYLPGHDATPNVYLALSLLKEGNVSLDTAEYPFMFVWRIWNGKKWVVRGIRCWDQSISGIPAKKLKNEGLIRLVGERYFITKSIIPDLYVGNYGLGPPLFLAPFFAAAKLFVDDLENNHAFLWYSSKTIASLFVAGSAIFVLLTAMRFVGRKSALVIFLTYGLGTCVWSISSQAMMQHAPTEFFVAMGTYLLVRIQDRQTFAFWCGLAYGAAVISRPTCALLVFVVGLYLIIVDRKGALFFSLGVFPMALVLGIYNGYYFGAPWSFGQTESAKMDVAFKIGPGVDTVWATPLYIGLAGNLFSPSRGLFVYSPFIIFSIWGAWKAWRQETYLSLRPLIFGALAIIIVQAKWFDWWSGWSFGYRHIVDTIPIFAIYLIPVIDSIRANKVRSSIFFVLMVWAIFVQVLGAFAYDIGGWNNKKVYTVQIPLDGSPMVLDKRREVEELVKYKGAKILSREGMNIDLKRYRYRLWSIRDNMIFWYALNFNHSRERKKRGVQGWPDGFDCKVPVRSLGDGK